MTDNSNAARPFPEPRPRTDDQTGFTGLPEKYGPRRLLHDTPKEATYRLNTIRVSTTPGLNGALMDVVPYAEHRSSAPPSETFDVDTVVAWYLPGANPFDGYADRAGNRASFRRLSLRLRGFDWRPAVAFAPGREWVEQGAFVLNASEGAVREVAVEMGQAVVVRWDPMGIVPINATDGVLLGGDEPTAVDVVPARTGCPMRKGADGWCRNPGYWTTSTARRVAGIWETHRQYLIDSLGCTVCLGGQVAREQYANRTSLFQPTREGGWADPVPFRKPESDGERAGGGAQ